MTGRNRGGRIRPEGAVRRPGVESSRARHAGAALYRAGRFEVAIDRIENGIKERNGKQEAADWTFLAMAHHRLGHHDQARRYLDRLRNRQPSTDPNVFWDELEIRLVRSEAEAVILYDPIFPADPFAH